MSAPLILSVKNQAVKTVQEWRKLGRSWRSAARKYAAENQFSAVWRADDTAIVFFRDGDTVRQKTIKDVEWVS